MRHYLYAGYEIADVDGQTRLKELCFQKWDLRGNLEDERVLSPLFTPHFFEELRKVLSTPETVVLTYRGRVLNAILSLESERVKGTKEGLETFDVMEFQGITYGFLEENIQDAYHRVFHENKGGVDAKTQAGMCKQLFEYACEYGDIRPTEVLNDPYFDCCRCAANQRDYRVGGAYERALAMRALNRSDFDSVDRLVFFDIECSNCDRGQGKICEFSYYVTSLEGEELEAKEILINPGEGPEFEFKLLRPGDELHLKYEANDYRAYRLSPTFDAVLPQIEELLTDPRCLPAGYAVLNDLRFLDYSFSRYGRRLPVRGAFDVQKLYTPVAHRQIKLEKAYELYSSGKPYDDGLTPHSSLDDAKMSAKTFFFYAKALHRDAKELCVGSLSNFAFLLDEFLDNVSPRDLSDQAKFRRDYSLYVQDGRAYLRNEFQSRWSELFCDADYLKRYAASGQGKRVYFSLPIQEKGKESVLLVDSLLEKGYFLARNRSEADILLLDEFEDPSRYGTAKFAEMTLITSLDQLPA